MTLKFLNWGKSIFLIFKVLIGWLYYILRKILKNQEDEKWGASVFFFYNPQRKFKESEELVPGNACGCWTACPSAYEGGQGKWKEL